MFSDIVQRFDAPLNALYRERDARRSKGLKTIDLVSGNVNRAGFIFPPAVLKQALAAGAERARIYTPDPLGQPVAREAVSAYYAKEGLRVPVEQIVLTSGTSLSYWYVFKLLANPGDEILCPKPSYPLLDSIAELSDVKLTGYRLVEGDRWRIDFDSLRSGITPRTRAIVLISPHNPTGAVATQEELSELSEIAARHHLPIISDEVFSAFVFGAGNLPRPASPHPNPLPKGEGTRVLEAPLVFTLNGLSKMFALPGLKIGWIAVTGETTQVKKAVHALDLISDTFLPVNEAAQFALPVIFKKGKTFLSRYQRGIQQRAEQVVNALKNVKGLSFVKPEGGFYLTLRTEKDEEKIVLDLLQQEGLLLHPGYFYDMEGSHVVLSFAAASSVLTASLPKIIRYLHQPERK